MRALVLALLALVACGTPATPPPPVVQTVVVPQTVVAAQTVAGAPADGYTLLATYAGSQAINQSLYPKLSFDSIRDFQTVATFARTACWSSRPSAS